VSFSNLKLVYRPCAQQLWNSSVLNMTYKGTVSRPSVPHIPSPVQWKTSLIKPGWYLVGPGIFSPLLLFQAFHSPTCGRSGSRVPPKVFFQEASWLYFHNERWLVYLSLLLPSSHSTVRQKPCSHKDHCHLAQCFMPSLSVSWLTCGRRVTVLSCCWQKKQRTKVQILPRSSETFSCASR
jgi:hypothetical protein